MTPNELSRVLRRVSPEAPPPTIGWRLLAMSLLAAFFWALWLLSIG